MKDNFEQCFQLVLKSEGGYVWDKSDPGGETNKGVTRAAWSEYLKRPIQDGEMAKLTVKHNPNPQNKHLLTFKICKHLNK